MFNMDKGNKCITWAGNFCRKLEAMCGEVEGIMHLEEASGFFQDRVQEVQQFFSAFMEGALPSSPEGSVDDHEPLVGRFDADVINQDNSDIDVEEDLSEKELLHSFPQGTVEDHGLVVAGADARVTDHGKSDMDVEEDHLVKELLFSSLVEDVTHCSSFSEQTSDCGTFKNLEVHINANEEHIKEENQQKVCKSSMEIVERSCSASISSSPPPSSISGTLFQACKSQLPDTGFTLDYSMGESTEEASHIVLDKSQLKDSQSVDEVKLEESCIIVDSNLLQSLYSEVGRCRFYKSACPTKMGIRKWRSANCHEDGDLKAGTNQQKGNSLEHSFLTVESVTPEEELACSDWEII